MLRKSSFEKEGGQWGWDTKGEYDKVLKELKAESKSTAKEKPAAAAKAKPAAKKAKAKTKAAA